MTDQTWTYRDILLALKSKGWSLRRLAKSLQLSPSGATYAIRNGSSPELNAQLEAILGISWTRIFPDRCPSPWKEGPP